MNFARSGGVTLPPRAILKPDLTCLDLNDNEAHTRPQNNEIRFAIISLSIHKPHTVQKDGFRW
jgi:hypothetical protein